MDTQARPATGHARRPYLAPMALELDRVTSVFQQTFGQPATVVASAPGRVNLIGEHLDYNGGPVLPFAIERRVWVAVCPAPGYSLWSSTLGGGAMRRSPGPRRGDWTDYVLGVDHELRSRHQAPDGAMLAVVSELPVGAGLSSSAALAVATAAALAGLTGRRLDPDAAADAAYRAEHDYVGVRCGRMDQTIVAHASAGGALLFETDSGARRKVPLGFRTWILPTGVDHSLADGGYNARRAECERALEICRRRLPDLTALARLDPEALEEVMPALPPPLDRRVRHVVTETERTRLAAVALERDDLAEVGRLLVAGHASLRQDYECSVPEADVLVDAALEHGALGARLTGAGWGGSVIMLAPEAVAARAAAAACERLARGFAPGPEPWSTAAAGGVRLDVMP
jgi:galactokinase